MFYLKTDSWTYSGVGVACSKMFCLKTDSWTYSGVGVACSKMFYLKTDSWTYSEVGVACSKCFISKQTAELTVEWEWPTQNVLFKSRQLNLQWSGSGLLKNVLFKSSRWTYSGVGVACSKCFILKQTAELTVEWEWPTQQKKKETRLHPQQLTSLYHLNHWHQ